MIGRFSGRTSWIAVVLLISGVFWLFAPAPAVSERAATAAENWDLPPVARKRPEDTPEYSALAALWGSVPASAESASLNEPDWRILGIVRAGGERFVLIKVDGQPEKRLSVRDKLPGGSEIVSIGEDALCVLVNGARRSLGIYKTSSQVL